MSQSAETLEARMAALAGVERPRLRWTPYLLEARSELLQTWREPAFSVPTLLFPAMFYLFFGIVFSPSGAYSGYLMVTYGAFGVIGTALFGFGVGVAIARESGELRLKRVAPVPPLAFLGAKMVAALVFSALVLAELFALGALFGDVVLTRGQWAGLAAVLLAGAVPFAAMGLAIGAWASGKGAPAIVNLIYLPMAFLSGLWIPIGVLPGVLQKLAPALPPYHLAQLALGVIGQAEGRAILLHVLLHVGVLAAVTAAGLAAAARGLRR